MCNSWNHSFECTCGFGGEGHRGSHSGSVQNFTRGDIRAHYESYVVPNARCPECGEYVYFYQSPFGGRVFFDDLGIPWPKHPCTDSTLTTITTFDLSSLQESASAREHRWEAEGWRPFTLWHFTSEKLFGTYSDYVNKISEHNMDLSGRYSPFYQCTEDIPLIALRLPPGQNLLERKMCIFAIYPTFIRGSDRGEQFFELSTFRLEWNGEITPITVTDAYMPRLNIGETVPAHSEFKFEKKMGTLVPCNRPFV